MLGDSGRVNALHTLVQEWMDTDPGHTIGVLAQRAGMHRNTIYAAIKDGAGVPRKATMEKLARGLGVPVQKVKDAAYQAAGFRVEAIDNPESPEIRGWLALLDELPPERRQELWDIGAMYLRRAKDAP